MLMVDSEGSQFLKPQRLEFLLLPHPQNLRKKKSYDSWNLFHSGINHSKFGSILDDLPLKIYVFSHICTYENYKTLIKSLLFQKLLPNLDIIYVYILFNSVYVYIYTNHGNQLDNILGFR